MVFYNNVIAGAAGAGAGGDDFTIQRSLRFNDGDTAHCSRTPSSAGNRKTMTWSLWVKRGDLAVEANLFTVDDGSGNTAAAARFDTDGKMKITDGVGGEIVTDRKFRDASAWYHLVIAFDTTQATASNRLRLYVNGAQVTSLASASYPTQNADTDWNTIQAHYIGRQVHNTANKFDGYLAEVHFVDGQALDHTDFGEFDTNGVWNPKKFAGSYGGNGYYLKFADNSTAAALGTDSSGNNNTWTILNISVAAGSGNDSLIDTPLGYDADSGNNGGNYATLNPLDMHSDFATSNGNLNIATTGSTWRSVRATIGISSGKYYWEFTTGHNRATVGISLSPSSVLDDYIGNNENGWSYLYDGNKYHNAVITAYGNTYASGDTIGVAFDADAGNIYFYKNGTIQNSGNPAYTGLTSGPYYPSFSFRDSGVTFVANFGQRPFAISSVPSGYKSLCTQNLSDPTYEPAEAFDIKLWNGNDSQRDITGFATSPDIVWIKQRSGNGSHSLMDTLRGATKHLTPSDTPAEGTESAFLNAFLSNGFSIGNSSTVNDGSSTYVAWGWDTGTTANPVGDIWYPGGGKYFGVKFPTASGGTIGFGQTSGTNTVQVWSSSDNSNWTQQGGTLTLADGHTITTTDRYILFKNTADATMSNVYVAATNNADAHYSGSNHGPSGDGSWSGPGYTDYDFRDGGGALVHRGGLTSSLYDTSRTWSNSITTTGNSGNWHSSYPKTQAFNNNDANYAHANADGSGQAVVTLSFSPALACSSTVTFLGGVTSSGTGTLQVNGGTAVALVDAGTNPQATHKTSASFSGNITSIVITKTGNTNDGLLVYGFEIDGKRLVDNGTTVPTIPQTPTITRANSAAGFSVISFKNGNTTVAHGLSSPPELIITKNRGATYTWSVYSKATTKDKYMAINSNIAASAVAGMWGSAEPTSNEFGTTTYVASDGADMVGYCFHSVPGFSAIGTFTGNNLANGPYVPTGFRVKYLLAKRTSGVGDWIVQDVTRSPENDTGDNNTITANVNNAEDGFYTATQVGIDFLSNGFKIRFAGGPLNDSGSTYFYMAFAEHPFKTARAR